jgi:hypothetical protein
MRLRSALKLPKEHGAWAMFYVPFGLGCLAAGTAPPPVWLLLLSTSALFISRESLLTWWRARKRGRQTPGATQAGRLLIAYLSIAVASGAPLILVYRFYWLLPLALAGGLLLTINGKQATEFEDRSVRGEIVAITGLTMMAPAAYYVAHGAWDRTALWLWALSAAYFASSVFYVKLRVTGAHAKRQNDKRRARWQCVAYHSLLLVLLTVLTLNRSLPLFALIAFAPVLARTCWSLLKPAESLNLKRIGMTEILYSLIFLTLMALTFRAVT